MALFSDRKPDILLNLGNRQDLDSGAAPTRLDRWCRDAYIDLCACVRFDTLKTTKNAQTVTGVGSDIISWPADARAIDYITMVDPNSNNTQVLDEKDIKYIRQFTAPGTSPSIPSVFAMWGTKVVVRPVPDKPYTIIWDYWQKAQILNPVASTLLNIPDDWLEIFDYMVMIRGHVALLERDKAMEIQQYLYGFKTQMGGKMVPGVIAAKMTMNQAMSPKRDFGITPKIMRYNA